MYNFTPPIGDASESVPESVHRVKFVEAFADKKLSFSSLIIINQFVSLYLKQRSLIWTPVAAVVVVVSAEFRRRSTIVRCWRDVDATAAVAATASTGAGVGHCAYSTLAAAASAAGARSYRASDGP